MQSLIEELLEKQTSLCANVVDDNKMVTDCEAVAQVHSTMIKTQQYYTKLLQMKKDMMDLHKQSLKLKERAHKLERTQRNLAEKRTQQQKHDESLIAKPRGQQ